MNKMKLAEYYNNVRKSAPLIHNITNYVTVNDVANVLLACGASPVMADDVDDARDITAICDALVINIGTLGANTIPAMFEAGRRSVELGHPIVLDPVGAGASALRTQTATQLLQRLRVAVVRGNVSEIKALAGSSANTRGVDASGLDVVCEDNLGERSTFAREYAGTLIGASGNGAVVAITGAIDIVADAERAYAVRNGCAQMSRITGSGCMLSALVAAFVAANQGLALEATLAAVATMGVAGELALARLGGSERVGTASFREALIDAIALLSPSDLDTYANIEEL